ncbi:hypothetical protein [Falsiroseomonas oryzae]|uniref:hypothetical protein n=1 Tax=Falsiroseomonas oryzae TaxID=2766473 RepID=UPI0022EB6663|nr:hypothetical protein [Roseomonas sp. MO-31]
MADQDRGRKGGTSFPNRPDTRTKTARPTSVGPHDVRRDQEDPGNPGITPEQGYGAEIARNREAADAAPAKAPVTPSPRTETADESGGTEEMLRKPGPARDAPPLSGTAKE